MESFHGKLKDEFVKPEVFENLRDAAAKAAAWREDCNTAHPHSTLGYQTPAAFRGRLAEEPNKRRDQRGSERS